MRHFATENGDNLQQVTATLFPFSIPVVPDGLTDDEFDALLDLEHAWRSSLPHYTFFQLMEVFPESIAAARRGVNQEIRQVKDRVSELDDYRTFYHESFINKAKFREQAGMIEDLNARIAQHMEEYETELKKLGFYIKHLDHLKDVEEAAKAQKKGKPAPKPRAAPKASSGIDDADIARAREVPIRTLVKVSAHRKMLCLWHTDKHPSMHVYKDHAYCFVCNKRADSIDVVMQMYHLAFQDAVKWLLKV